MGRATAQSRGRAQGMVLDRRFSPLGLLGAVCLFLLALEARAADLAPPPPEPSLFSARPDPYTALCGGRCALTAYAGPRLDTGLINAFGLKGTDKFVPPWNYRYGDSGIAGLAFSRTWYSFRDWFDIETEVGVAKRYGSLQEAEVWGALYGRWRLFPWSHIVRTSFAISTGLNYASGVPFYEVLRTETPEGSRLLHFFSPEITLGLPSHPDLDLVLRVHHRSGGKIFGCVRIFNCASGGAQHLTAGLRYRF